MESIRGQTITTYTELSQISPDNVLDLNQRNSIFAFYIESSNQSINTLLDPAYVRLSIGLDTFEDDEFTFRDIPYHKCTDEDYAKFYEINSSDK